MLVPSGCEVEASIDFPAVVHTCGLSSDLYVDFANNLQEVCPDKVVKTHTHTHTRTHIVRYLSSAS